MRKRLFSPKYVKNRERDATSRRRLGWVAHASWRRAASRLRLVARGFSAVAERYAFRDAHPRLIGPPRAIILAQPLSRARDYPRSAAQPSPPLQPAVNWGNRRLIGDGSAALLCSF